MLRLFLVMSTRVRILLGVSLGFCIGVIAASKRRVFGHPKEWKQFERAHPSFLATLPELNRLVTDLFDSRPTALTPDRKLIFLLGCLCAEDFKEIVLLCGNGYGVAAAKVVRSLYEHAVTAQHILRHPENAALFDEYVHVQDKKLIQHMRDAIDPTEFAGLFSNQRTFQAEADSARVRSNYKRTSSWSPLSLRDMAFQDGEGLERLYALCYVLPSAHLHSTPRGIYSRIVERDGNWIFQNAAQREDATACLSLATGVLLLSLRTVVRTFAPEVEGELFALGQRLMADWANNPVASS